MLITMLLISKVNITLRMSLYSIAIQDLSSMTLVALNVGKRVNLTM